MNRLLALALLLCLSGCGPQPLPAPALVSISPATMEESESLLAEVTVQAVLPFHVSLDDGSATADPQVLLQVGPLTATTGRLDAQGKAKLFIPSALVAGAYDVKVTLSDGRSATLAGAFTVTPGSFPSSYAVEDVPNQRAGVPFTVTLRAQGAAAASFHGTVALSAPGRATVTPAQSGPFIAGVRMETVTLTPTTGDPNTILLVQDLANHFGASNVFKLNP